MKNQLERTDGIIKLPDEVVNITGFKSPRNERILYLKTIGKSGRDISRIILAEFGDDLSIQRISDIYNSNKKYIPSNL